MSLTALYVGNFKGIKENHWIEIKPITIFIGRNSSGKSSCIHALASLSQTTKLTNNNRPLILDDEYASIHLGRFIEVIHTKTYEDSINLGLKIDKIGFLQLEGNKNIKKVGNADAVFKFKSTKRTQEVYLEIAHYTIGEHKFVSKRNANQTYTISDDKGNQVPNCIYKGGLILDQMSFYTLNPQKFMVFQPLFSLQLAMQQQLQNVYYLGPFRQSPIRRYPTRGASPNEVGPQGESTATLLANEFIQSRTRKHILQIANWLETMELAKKVDVSRVGSSDMFEINITLQDGKKFPLADLGYGLSQILPVLTQCSFASESSTLLFEQPEIHLHPKSARYLTKIFVDTYKKKNAKILAETHSIEMLGQLQREIQDGNIKSTEVAAYLVKREDKQTILEHINIEEDGDVYNVDWRRELTGI
jgi:predicted ATPase